MRDISTKVDNVGDELSAEEFNSDQDELENVVISTDQSLDSGAGPDNDLNMLGKSMAAYSSGGQYYNDNGGVNNYILARSTNLKPVPSYKNGMMAIFKASSANTGASTINISSLGSKNLTQFDGSALDASQIVTNDYISVIYNSTNDRFELMGSGVSEFAAGTVMLFGNTTAPVGWTRKTDWQNSAMFCYKATGAPNNGGVTNPQSVHNHTGPSHTHTMQNHTHNMQSHVHTGPNHRHAGGAHTHTGPNHAHTTGAHALTIAQIPAHSHSYNSSQVGTWFYSYVSGTRHGLIDVTGETGGGGTHSHGDTGVGGTGATGSGGVVNTNYSGSGNTGIPSAANTGSPSNNTTVHGGTGNTGNNSVPYFQELIAATKD